MVREWRKLFIPTLHSPTHSPRSSTHASQRRRNLVRYFNTSISSLSRTSNRDASVSTTTTPSDAVAQPLYRDTSRSSQVPQQQQQQQQQHNQHFLRSGRHRAMVSSSRAAVGFLLSVVIVVATGSISGTSSSNAVAPRRTLLGRGGGIPGDGNLEKKGGKGEKKKQGEKGEEKGEDLVDPRDDPRPSCTDECKRYEESVKAFCASPGFNEKKCDWATAGLSLSSSPTHGLKKAPVLKPVLK
jgi:hypothetical protein